MLQRVNKHEWDQLVLDWETECNSFGEDFCDYATASLPVLENLAYSAPRQDAGVFSYRMDGRAAVMCQANSTFLPGYQGKVLRIRHITLAPRFDYSDEIDVGIYSETLAKVFSGAISLSHTTMPSDHIKFHLKSPAERSFGDIFTSVLKETKEFKEADIKGSWIYLSKG